MLTKTTRKKETKAKELLEVKVASKRLKLNKLNRSNRHRYWTQQDMQSRAKQKNLSLQDIWPNLSLFKKSFLLSIRVCNNLKYLVTRHLVRDWELLKTYRSIKTRRDIATTNKRDPADQWNFFKQWPLPPPSKQWALGYMEIPVLAKASTGNFEIYLRTHKKKGFMIK